MAWDENCEENKERKKRDMKYWDSATEQQRYEAWDRAE